MRLLVHTCRHTTGGVAFIPALYVPISGPATGADDHVWFGCWAQLTCLQRGTE